MLFLALVAVAAPPEPPPPAPHVIHWRSQVDWTELGDETVQMLSDYLAVDTVNPPGNEAAAADFLEDLLEGEGISTERIVHTEGRHSLLARIEGDGDGAPLCLMHHVDVASWEPDQWTHDASSGEVDEDGWIWGRGALDMKGMGALEVMSMIAIQRLGIPLRRDVVLLAVADEEVDNTGARALVDRWEDIGCSHMINEGGLGLRDAFFDGQHVHAISTAEKGILWVRMKASGKAGHGSTPYPGEAPERLLEAMNDVQKMRRPARIDPILFELLKRVGRHKGGLTGAILRSKLLVRLLVKGRLNRVPATRAAIHNTVHLTGSAGANAPNVVPSEVYAQYDVRLLPGVEPDAFLEELRAVTAGQPWISWEVISKGRANGSPIDDPFYDAIARYAVEEQPDAVAAPVLSVGFTDSLLLRPLGVHAYGYVPFIVDEDEAVTMHGHDERVSVDNVHHGVRTLFSIVVDFAGDPDRLEPVTR